MYAAAIPTTVDLSKSIAVWLLEIYPVKSLTQPVASLIKPLNVSNAPPTVLIVPSAVAILSRSSTKLPTIADTSLMTPPMLSKANFKFSTTLLNISWTLANASDSTTPLMNCSPLSFNCKNRSFNSPTKPVKFCIAVTSPSKTTEPIVALKSSHVCFKFPMTFSQPSASRDACPIAPDTLLASSYILKSTSCCCKPDNFEYSLPNNSVALALRVVSVDKIPKLSATWKLPFK